MCRRQSRYLNCPRCGERTLEALSTYAHCPNCLYSPELDERKRYRELPLDVAMRLIERLEAEDKRGKRKTKSTREVCL